MDNNTNNTYSHSSAWSFARGVLSYAMQHNTIQCNIKHNTTLQSTLRS